MDEAAKYNDRMYYGFLTFFTVIIGVMAYMINC